MCKHWREAENSFGRTQEYCKATGLWCNCSGVQSQCNNPQHYVEEPNIPMIGSVDYIRAEQDKIAARRLARTMLKMNIIATIASIIFGLSVGLFVYMILKPQPAHAALNYDSRAVLAIIGESEDQGERGMLATACAIRNRGTLKGVFGERAPRVKNKEYSEDIFFKAAHAWAKSDIPEYCEFMKGSNSWENTKAFGEPYWVASCKETITVKDHRFFKCPEVRK